MMPHDDDEKSTEEPALRDDNPADRSEPWAKTSSGDADSITEDEEPES
jgi:hypothetical protein